MNQRKHQEDYELVHQYLCGDKAAGQKLYSEAFPLLQKLVLARTKGSVLNSEDINDIIMESFKRSIEKLDRFDGSSKFISWVIGIAQFVIKEHLRKKTKLTFTEDIFDAKFENITSLHNKDPLIVLLNKESYEAVNAAINQLLPEHKQIIQLRLLNKVSVKEISAMSGKSDSAINSLFSRALRALKENLKKI